MITGQNLTAGDVILGIASSGIHSNGYSLVRKVFRMKKEALEMYYESLGSTLGETLLTPTKIYVKALRTLKENNLEVKACCHITGGGFYENVPRMLKEDVAALIHKGSYPIPPIFDMLSKDGDIPEHVMYNTFNMGIGMMVVVDKNDANDAMKQLEAAANA